MIRSQENEDDKRIAEEKLDLEREKMRVREETDEEKMRSQEDIAALRAQISREKWNKLRKSNGKSNDTKIYNRPLWYAFWAWSSVIRSRKRR